MGSSYAYLERVSSLFDLERDYITGRGRQKDRVEARDLLCYWSAMELGISMADLAKMLGMTISAVSYAVQRGEKTAKEGDYLSNVRTSITQMCRDIDSPEK